MRLRSGGNGPRRDGEILRGKLNSHGKGRRFGKKNAKKVAIKIRNTSRKISYNLTCRKAMSKQ